MYRRRQARRTRGRERAIAQRAPSAAYWLGCDGEGEAECTTAQLPAFLSLCLADEPALLFGERRSFFPCALSQPTLPLPRLHTFTRPPVLDD